MLNLDLATIAFQIANFLILSAVLYYVLFRPAMRQIKENATERERLTRELAEERQEAERLHAEWEERLSNAREEADQIIADAQRHADIELERMLASVEKEAKRILAEAQKDAQQLRRRTVDDFHAELLEAILDISAQVINQAAPPAVHDTLIKELDDRIWEMGRSEMARVEALRRSLGQRAPTAYVATAHPLSREQQGEVARTLSALADRNVDLEIEIVPALGAGLQVRLGDIVVENSIAGRLKELRGSVVNALQEYAAEDDLAESKASPYG
ncbi:MAG TPA: hypothetical protein ENN99_00815 [Chloroflexi bacterium]|nr:hypothetical protein [Chloroflexota bacterium]